MHPLVQLQLNVLGARRNQVSGAMDPTSLLLLIPLESDAKQAQDEANYEDTLSARGLVPVPTTKGDCKAENVAASL